MSYSGIILNRDIILVNRGYPLKGLLRMGLWLGETGGAFNSGRNTVTNRFMSAFWYLDWLGTLSKYGHAAFCRQTLLGGNYGLLQNENGVIRPNPDFWAADLFNRLMVGDVLNGKQKINVKIQLKAHFSLDILMVPPRGPHTKVP